MVLLFISSFSVIGQKSNMLAKPGNSFFRLHDLPRRNSRVIQGRTGMLQAGRCFQVLTKAVGIKEYGTVVMLFQASSVGS